MASISTSSTAFDRALSNFKSGLTPAEKLDFAQTSIEDVYKEAKAIQERQGKRGMLRNLRKIQPYINGLVQFSGVIEVLVQGKPEIMAFIWGPTKLLLQITSTYTDSFDKLLNALEKIGENLPRFEKFADIFRGDSRMEQVIIMVYEDILSFHHSTLKFFRTKAWKQLFKSLWSTFEDRFGGILSSLERHRALVDNEATAAHIVAAHEARSAALRAEKEALRDREMRQLRSLKEWLDPVNYEAYLAKLGHPCKKTGTWLIQNGDFNTWLDIGNITKRLLWLTGIPGSGKTFLSYLVLQHVKLQLHSGGSVIFAFLRSGDSTFTMTMRSLVFQLLSQNRQLLPYLNDKCESKAYCPLTSKEEFEEVLEVILGNINVTYLIIDGLDEIELEEREIVLSILLSLLSKVDNLKIFLSSRLEADISDALGPVLGDIYQVDIGSNNQPDIATYVSIKGQAVLKKFNVDDTTRREIEGILDRVVHGARGMFLWARLVIYSLLQQFNLKGLEDAARDLPVGLDAAYGRILDRINMNLTPDGRDLAKRVLEWVLCGTRPLRLKELEQAMAIRSGDKCTNRRRRFLRRLDELCGPILEIDKWEKVHFVHFTAKEYLISEYSGPFIYPLMSHRSIASTCISYLSFSCFDDGLSDEQVIENIHSGEYCLHEYAERNWLHHIRHATKEDDQFLHDLIDLLSSFIDLQRDTEIPHTSLRVSPENEFPIILKRWPQLHKNLIDCHFYYSTKLGPEGAPVESPLKLHRPIRRFRKHLENLFISLSSPNDNIRLQPLTQTYGPNLFKCLQPNCVHYLEGFDTQIKREEHLQRHSRPFKCSIQTCDFSSIGFASTRALDNHSRLYHLVVSAHVENIGPAEADSSESFEGDKNLALILFDAIATSDFASVESLLAQDLDVDLINEKGETTLLYALSADSEDIVRLLLEKGANPNRKDPTGKPILYSAIRQGSESLVELLLEWGAGTDRNVVNEALILGAAKSFDIVKVLLSNGADVNSKGVNGRTALMVAAESGAEETVRALLESGADVNAEDGYGNPVLNLGAAKSFDVVKVLLSNGADVNLKGAIGRTALMVAAVSGAEETVRALLESGADVNAKDGYGNPVLNLGAAKSFDVVKVLLSNGADVNLKGAIGRTALMAAAESGAEETVRALLESGADVNAKDNYGNSALKLGAAKSFDVVKVLLSNGADVNLKEVNGTTALMAAAESGAEETVRALLESGADANATNKSGDSALGLGANSSIIIKIILENGVGVNSRTVEGKTALMTAARLRDEKAVRNLLDFGADVNAKDNRGDTALIHGVLSEGMVKLLVENGADVNLKGHKGQTALMQIAGSYQIPLDTKRALNTIRYLMSGATIDGIDNAGNSALIIAARNTNAMSLVKIFLKQGADIDFKGSTGQTALMVAVKGKSRKMVKALLEGGANVHLQDDDGRTALEVAEKRFVRLLLAHGASPNGVETGV